jgi:opacity protein-like surface antigen
MRKLFLAATLVVSLAAIATAQNSNKFEGFAGFSVDSFDTGLSHNNIITNGNDRETALGFDTSATGYINDRFGIEGNFDGHFKSRTFNFQLTPTGPITSVDARLSSYNFMAGPHYRFSTSGKFTPFVRAMAGGNHSRVSSGAFTTGGVPVAGNSASETDFAMKFGGGVDIGWTKRAAVRLSGDYNPIFQKADGGLNPDFGNRRTRNEAVFSVGLVFK